MSNSTEIEAKIVAPPQEHDVPPSGERSYREIQADVAARDLRAASEPFLNWLAAWNVRLRTVKLDDIVRDPARTALVSADVIVGFCNEGPLASPRVGAIVPPIVKLLNGLHTAGVSRYALLQEWHDDHAPEFEQYGRHCVRDTHETETVAELLALPFADQFTVIHKNSINPALGTAFDAWLDAPEQSAVDTFVVVGDCTDLCTYQLAMHVKLKANAAGRKVRVVVPADCLQTYDMPVETAEQLGIMPHSGDLLHPLFLYHMALNGCEVVKSVEVHVAHR